MYGSGLKWTFPTDDVHGDMKYRHVIDRILQFYSFDTHLCRKIFDVRNFRERDYLYLI